MYPIDPRNLLADGQFTPFEQDKNIDVQGATAVVTGTYAVFSYTVPDNKVLIVKGWCPYARARLNVGDPTETFANLPATDFSGWGVFTPAILPGQGGTPLLANVDNVLLHTAAGASDLDRLASSGTAWTSDTPRKDAYLQAAVPWGQFVVDSNKEFKILFRLLPAPAATPIPFRFTIQPANPQKRVDVLGCVVVGVETSKSYYEEVRKRITNFPQPA